MAQIYNYLLIEGFIWPVEPSLFTMCSHGVYYLFTTILMTCYWRRPGLIIVPRIIYTYGEPIHNNDNKCLPRVALCPGLDYNHYCYLFNTPVIQLDLNEAFFSVDDLMVHFAWCGYVPSRSETCGRVSRVLYPSLNHIQLSTAPSLWNCRAAL